MPRVWTELMGTVNFRPVNAFHATLSGSVGNFGTKWGLVLNVCPRSLNFFAGIDLMAGKFTPQMVPINNVNMNLNFGFSVAMGGPAKWEHKAKKAERRGATTTTSVKR